MQQSAGILLYRQRSGQTEFFLVHPGGPFFASKDEGWWTVPKGEFEPPEDPLAAAVREFEEETGYKPSGKFIPLEPITQKGGKRVQCWAVAGDLDPASIVSNTFQMQWPPRSGKQATFPEIDRAGWFPLAEAQRKILESQARLLLELAGMLG